VDRFYCREIPKGNQKRDQNINSIQHILPKSEDFGKEDTALRRSSDGVARLLRTPKGYCELAGKGIEYCWGQMEKGSSHDSPLRYAVVQQASPRVDVAREPFALYNSQILRRVWP
jgi:hypothetical protein